MRLLQGEIRPGKVLRVEDSYGTIKGSCIGMFAEDEDPDKLPPIYPFFKLSPTTFSQPHPDDKIWVIFFADNPWELFYVFQGDVRSNNKEVLDNDYDDVEILLRRKNPDDRDALVEYNSDDGVLMKNSEAIVQVNQDENIHIERPGTSRTIEVNEEGISLGSPDKSAEPAVLGDKCETALKSIYKCLNNIAQAAQGNPYTNPIAGAIQASLMEIQTGIEQIKSENVTLD